MSDKSTLGEIVLTEDNSLTLKHPDHGEEYHSRLGALRESEGLYIDCSGFKERLNSEQPAIKVLDVGLGLAYNAMCTLNCWCSHDDPPDLFLTSLEINHELVAALVNGQAPWTTGWPKSWIERGASLQRVDDVSYHANIPHKNGKSSASWRIHVGDATGPHVLVDSSYYQGFDYVWQDPFSPQKNPSLWSCAWFKKVKSVSSSQVILMTYSVARVVRDNLTHSGWICTKIPTIGQKRHWLKAHLPEDPSDGKDIDF